MTRSSRLTLATSTVLALAAPATASAAQLVTQKCVRALDSQPVALVAGAGFSPNGEVRLRWSEGTEQTVTAGPDGRFGTDGKTAIAGPRRIRGDGPRPVILGATDLANPTVTAVTGAKAVRYDVGLPARVKPGQRVRYRLFGFPARRVAYAHIGYRGRIRARHRLGTPRGDCGLLTVSRPLLPRGAGLGEWRVTITLGPRLTRSSRVYRAAYNVYRTVRPRLRVLRGLG